MATAIVRDSMGGAIVSTSAGKRIAGAGMDAAGLVTERGGGEGRLASLHLGLPRALFPTAQGTQRNSFPCSLLRGGGPTPTVF
jgi:hypothetical protein